MRWSPWPRRRSPLRTELAAFIRSHAAEVVSEWTARIAPVFDIQASLMPEISQNMYDALVRWAKHIEDPSNTETYAYLYQHARHGFISHSPASRFLSGQMKIRLLLLERLQTAYAADRKRLAELASLLDQEFSERILHITDFFVEATRRPCATSRKPINGWRASSSSRKRWRRSVSWRPASRTRFGIRWALS